MTVKSFIAATLGLAVIGALTTGCSPADSGKKLTFWHDEPREVRYHPDGEWFVGNNGTKRFTRAIYGTNTGFRFETSDFPEFGLYMPRLGGSLYLAVATPDTTVWLRNLENIESRFRSGERRYKITDSRVFGKNGMLEVGAVAMSDADGFLLKLEPHSLPEGTQIVWVYGGANNERFSREGDLGADPADSFFIKPERCKGNLFEISANTFNIYYGDGMRVLSTEEAYENAAALKDIKLEKPQLSDANIIAGTFPIETEFALADGNMVDSLPALLASNMSTEPVIVGRTAVKDEPLYVAMRNPKTLEKLEYYDLADAYERGEKYREQIAGRIKINTPDPYFNTLGGIFAGAEDAVWESPGYLHGAIGWRMPLTGWRASYLADLMGMHERARTHFNGYANAQVTDVHVTKPHLQDVGNNMARSAKVWGTPMYSDGYICRYPNRTDVMHHYDMNNVFIDELLWHFNWTGDWAYVREIFPVIKRHLAWEKQLFDPDNDFLYDAYCTIWASDAVQYNGGAGTHSTAYVYRANRIAAYLAEKIGEDPTPYQREADGILKAMNNTLWLPELGRWAEFKDNMGHKFVHDATAVWSVYHAIDSDTHTPFQAYEATRYVDTELPHIPVLANGLNDTTNYVIATTNWQPYMWSINNVAFAETTHTALAFWQSGRKEDAFKMLKGSILDAMYLGSGPGNITQVSFYDAARRELYRDFSDPVATGLRATVQGMYGIVPDLLNERLTIRPGFPAAWDFASLETMNMKYDFRRKGAKDSYEFTPNLKVKPSLTLELDGRKESVKSVTVNGEKRKYTVKKDAVGVPKIAIEAGKADTYKIEVEWAGADISEKLISTTVADNDPVSIKLTGKASEIYDPQGALKNSSVKSGVLTGTAAGQKGHRTVFVKTAQGDMEWWQPIDINIVAPLEIVENADGETLAFAIRNNLNTPIEGQIFINGSEQGKASIAAGSKQNFSVAAPVAALGTNRIELKTADKTYQLKAINWSIPTTSESFETVNLENTFNDKLNDIFAYGKYVAPRWPYTTLQVPTQGMGQWCHPGDLSKIDDSGLRAAAAKNGGVFRMPQGVPFATPADPGKSNIIFTTLWDNYPDSVTFALSGSARRAYLLIAASTYHMQSHIDNGYVTVRYTDGTAERLALRLPDNLIPLDQDIFTDGYAFRTPQPRPWRVRLKTADVSRNHAADLGKTISNNPIYVEGGMATMLDMPLDPSKKLSSLTLETVANEVIIGLMAVTLER